jgi:hypothetical protein
MSQRKSLLLTFDYELFLGNRSGSVRRCLIDPTNRVLEILDRHRASGLFFIDTLYLARLEKEPSAACRSDLQDIRHQLEQIIRKGHSIGLHIHPHWLDAVYEPADHNWNGENKTRFALSCLDMGQIQDAVSDSCRILAPFFEPGKLKTYRAGGFYCQPFKAFADLFAEMDVRIDFSVMRDFRSTGYRNLYGFNFTHPPKPYVYRFAEDPLVAGEQGSFIEVSVNSFKLSGITKIRNSVYFRMHKQADIYTRMGDGRGSGNIIAHASDGGFRSKIRNYSNFAVELMNPVLAEAYLGSLKREGYVHFVSHPKLFTLGGLSSFDQFLRQALNDRDVETDYREVIRQHLGGDIHDNKQKSS